MRLLNIEFGYQSFKIKDMKSAIRPLGIVILSIIGFLVIISQYTNKNNFKVSAKDLHSNVLSNNYNLDKASFDKLSKVNLIDIRDKHSFELKHEEKSVNIPLSAILNKEYKELFESENPKVILAHDAIKAHEAWMLLSQLGYTELYVLEL